VIAGKILKKDFGFLCLLIHHHPRGTTGPDTSDTTSHPYNHHCFDEGKE
jgi:hypothetical protein